MGIVKVLVAAVFIACGAAVAVSAQPVKLGAGTYFLAPKGGDKAPPPAPLRTEAMLKLAAPTSQWYSTLIFNPKPDPIYAQPLTFKTTPAGFEMALPVKQVVPTERQDGKDVEIHYAHHNALTFSPAAFEAEPARLAKTSDWAIDISMARGADQLLATVAHGSPYAYFQLTRGDVRINLSAPGERIGASPDARVLALRVKGTPYAVFGPTGVRWEQASPTQWIGRLPAGASYFSAAALPDEKAETVQMFTRHAYVFVTDTRAEWRYDTPASKVETTFTASTRVMEGPDNGPLLGLYPHQWRDNASVATKLGPSYDTVRGKIRLLEAAQFKTERRYTGFVPYWPKVTEGARLADFNDQFKRDMRRRRDLLPPRENADNWRTSVYWQGKGITNVTQLMSVAEQQGDLEARDQLLTLARERMEFWFSGQGSRNYFHYNKTLGTVSAYPDEFFSVAQMNDHHFHYGYWIRAAAEIALRDPAWAAKDKWGGMVDLLVSDIANTKRGSSEFPYLRNFDAYEGHSWAVGIGGAGEYGALGNNQESSSEAINAWAGLILWAETTGNRELRDLGVYLYTTEIESVNNYWFDIHRLVFPPEYKNVEASMVFGGKYAHNTWWTDEPRQIHLINLLPVATYSTYLATDPSFVKRNLDAMNAEAAAYQARGKFPPNPPPKDVGHDVSTKYLALIDPAAALAQFNIRGAVQDGDTAANTLHWMLSLQEMGVPDLTVTADTALYSVFRRSDGRRTYLSYNATKAPIAVRFSDGKTLSVAPGTLGRTQ